MISSRSGLFELNRFVLLALVRHIFAGLIHLPLCTELFDHLSLDLFESLYTLWLVPNRYPPLYRFTFHSHNVFINLIMTPLIYILDLVEGFFVHTLCLFEFKVLSFDRDLSLLEENFDLPRKLTVQVNLGLVLRSHLVTEGLPTLQ